MAEGIIPVRVPWTRQPPNRVDQFSKTFLGQHCIWAVVPGWDQFEGGGTTVGGSLRSVGQRMQLDLETIGTPVNSVIKITNNHGRGIGSVRSVEFDQTASADAYRFLRTTADTGIRFPSNRNLTILTLARPVPTNGDSRIFSDDLGTGGNDHDLMIGLVSAGAEARTRIRIGSSSQTVVTSGGAIQQDEIQLIAATVEPSSATNSIVRVHHLTQDGTYSTGASSSVTGSYNPRTTTPMAIGANAGAADNSFQGEIVCMCAFDIDLKEHHFRDFFDNPWQISEPRTQYIPVGVADVVGGRIMSSLAYHGGLAGQGGIAGQGGGLAG